MFKNIVVMKIFAFGAFLACPCRVTAEEEGPMQGLKIESTMERCSADYDTAKEEGQNPDEDEDKKKLHGHGREGYLDVDGKEGTYGRG